MQTKTLSSLVAAVLAASALSLSGVAGAADALNANAPQKPNLVKSGTVDVEAESMRLILGGAKGTGVLHFNGKDYRFKLKGASVGGLGVTKVESTGIVYNLKDIADFPGTYSGMGVGAVAIKGAGGSSWENNKGVVINMHAKDATGLAVNLGINAVEVELVQ